MPKIDWDSLVINKVKDIVPFGGTIIDVGAHVGNYSEKFLKIVGEEGKVISYELCPDNFKKLQKKLVLHENVIIRNCAVSDKTDFEEYYSNPLCGTFGVNILGYDVNHKKGHFLGSIESIRLDEVVDEDIDLIKIDVEGAELKVLRGLERIIDRIKYLIIECHFQDQWDELKKIIFDYDLYNENLRTGEIITLDTTTRPYQLFCQNKRLI